MKKLTDIYFTSATQTAESTFSLSTRHMALWKSQMEDHTSDWLRVVSISGLGHTMNGRTYRYMLCYRLGVPLFPVLKPCSACSRVFMGDIYGDHAVSCAGIVGIKHRHNVVRDTLVDICFRSEISAGSSPLTQTGMVDFVPGHAVIEAAQRKRVKYEAKCADIGYSFLPFSFSFLGELEKDAVTLLKRIRKFPVAQDIETRNAIHIFSRIDFSIARGAFTTKFSLPSFLNQVNKLTESQRTSIKRVGFGYLLQIPQHILRRSQLIELMDTWSIEKQAFVFPVGEISVTLLDVALILGLHVIGEPVVLKEDAPLTNLEKSFDASVSNRYISVESLKDRLESIGENDDQSFVRVFLLYCFGTLLFPSENGKVDSRYLSFLQDLNNVSCFAWGAAVLQYLNDWLTKRKTEKTNKIGGCLILLQIWYYEHIITGRPKLLDGTSTFPRVCRWDSSTRQYQTMKFEQLEHTQILWTLQPTSAEMKINFIRAIAQESYVRTAPGTIEQPIEVGSERVTRIVGVQREEEEPILQDHSMIFVSSDDEESNVIENLRREITELKGIIEEEREEKEVMKKLQDDNEELWTRRVHDEEEVKKIVQYENEELSKKIQDEEELKKRAERKIEQLRKKFQDEEELRKRVQFQYEELIKRVHNEEELRKRAQHDIEELLKRVHDEEDLRKIVQYENEDLRKKIQEEEQLRMRAQCENEQLRQRGQNEEEVRKRLEYEIEEFRTRLDDEEKLRKEVQNENENLLEKSLLNDELILDFETEMAELARVVHH
ncbi:putative reverse transcriptase domain-containing protein [Tanacetum coccineum]